jgi:LytS/YehU family sensor histidine kinase
MNNKKELNELKEAKLISDYNSLKDRLNPHFLFNNLSTLKSLIRYNPKIAEEFTQNFTNVYRYVLKSHGETTVSLPREVQFLESYIALHKERIGEGLTFHIRLVPQDLKKSLPPMALQLLVENAIKHNITNKQHPLKIQITSNGSTLTVKNNLNRKASTYSTHTGLASLKSQYKLIADAPVLIEEDDKFFCVELPLIYVSHELRNRGSRRTGKRSRGGDSFESRRFCPG